MTKTLITAVFYLENQNKLRPSTFVIPIQILLKSQHKTNRKETTTIVSEYFKTSV